MPLRGPICSICFHSIVILCPCLFSVGDKQPMILKWRILSATNDLDRVSAVALPKLPISLTNTDLKVASDTQFYPGLGTAGSASDSVLRAMGASWPQVSSR